MNPEQAIAVLSDVCKQFRGTLADHNAIQTALAMAKDALIPAIPLDPKPE